MKFKLEDLYLYIKLNIFFLELLDKKPKAGLIVIKNQKFI